MTRSLWILGLAAGLICTSCATRPTEAEIAAADYGRYPSEYRTIIREYMSEFLKDPQSAQYDFLNMPTPGWHTLGGRAFGWVVCARVNAKNSFGAFAGARRYYFLINDGNVLKRFGGDSDYAEAMATGACKTHVRAGAR